MREWDADVCGRGDGDRLAVASSEVGPQCLREDGEKKEKKNYESGYKKKKQRLY